MRAFRLHSTGHASVLAVASPEPCGNALCLDVCACALCRTDAKMWDCGHRDLVLPRTLGHEICAEDPETGGRWVVWPGQACGACSACCGGCENLCPSMRILGFHVDGGLATKVLVDRSALIPLPVGLDPHLATLAEPLGCCLNALDALRFQPGESLQVIGGGPVGLLMALAAVEAGGHARLCEREETRRERSRAFLECLGIGPATGSAVGDACDAAVAACPGTGAFTAALSALRPGGRFCFFSGLPGGKHVPAQDLNPIHYRQLTVTGAYGCTRDQMARALALLAEHGCIAARLIDGQFGLEDVPGLLPEILAGARMKCVIIPRE